MASDLEDLIKAVDNLDINKVSQEVIRDHKEDYTDLNREQMWEGLRSDNTLIKPPYAGLTIVEKERKGLPFDRVTLFDEGDFQKAMATDVDGEDIITSSSDYKTADLQEKYDTSRGSIFGLNKKNTDTFADKIEEPFQKKIQNELGL